MTTYSSDLKLSIIATGDLAGTWGQVTNTNLIVLQQAIAGYQSLAVNATTGLSLTFTDGAISTGKNATINLTGTLTGNVNVTVPDSIEKVYNVNNQVTHGVYTLTFKTTSGTGIKLAQGNRYVLYADGTNVNLVNMQQIWRSVSAAATVQPGSALLVDTSSSAFTITLPASPVAGDIVSFVDAKYTFDTNNLTIGQNGSNIANNNGNLIVNTEGAGFTLIYSGDATVGWTYREK